MNKYAGLLLAAAIIVSLIPIQAAKAADSNWQALYRDYIKEHYRQADADKNGARSTMMLLMDLDRDGTPELIGGSDSMTHSPVYVAATVRNGRIAPLKQVGGGISGGDTSTGFQMGTPAFDGIKLLRDKSTGEYKFVGEDYIMGADEQDGCQYEISLSGTTVTAKEISCRHLTRIDGGRFEVDLYSVGGQKSTEAEYDSQLKAYYSQFTEVKGGYSSAGYSMLYNYDSHSVNESVLNDLLTGYRAPEGLVLADVPADWAKSEVDQAIALKLVPGNLQQGYAQDISRADFSTLVVNLLTVKTGKTIEAILLENGKAIDASAFKDTADRTILAANALGIVGGKGSGLFDPDGSITRQEAAVMLTRTAKVLGKNVNRSGMDFADGKDTASWATEAVAFVSAAEDTTNHTKIMGGTGDRTFSPGGYYTKQQAFITVKRLYNVN